MGTPDGRTVLLLGCATDTPHGIDQVRRFAAQAHRRGVRVVGVDTAHRLAAVCDPVVDETVAADPADVREVSRRVGRSPVHAVVALREPYVEAAAELTTDRGLRGVTSEVARTIRNKDLARRALRDAGCAQPGTLLTGADDADGFLERTAPGPWIVKPRAGMGSQQISLVHDGAGLAAALRDRDPGRPYLIETFVVGPEYSAEGIVVGDVPVVLALTEKRVGAHFVEYGHCMPADLDAGTTRDATSAVVAALTTLGLTDCVFHAEFWLAPEGVVLGEVHARAGGGFLSTVLEQVRPGLELWGGLVDTLLGEPVPPPPPLTRVAVVEHLRPPVGVVESVEGWERIATAPDVCASALLCRPGDVVTQAGESAERSGVVVVVADTRRQAQDRVRDLLSGLRIVVS